MNLPGLGLEEPVEEDTVETTQHELTKDCEWRFEVAVGKVVQVKVGESRPATGLISSTDTSDRS